MVASPAPEISPLMAKAQLLDQLKKKLLEEEAMQRKEDGEEGVKPYSRKKDYYEALNLDPNASEAEIRRAFRRMSLRWHPDKQHGKPEDWKQRAALEYAELREAMDVLGHEATRREYDRVQAAARMANNPKEDLSDLDAAVKRTRPPPRRAPPVYYDVDVTLEELFTGCVKTVAHERRFADGSTRQMSLELTIPCGACGGTEYLFRGMGHHQDAAAGVQPSDVVCVLREVAHTSLERQGDDLVAFITLPTRESGGSGTDTLLVALEVCSLFGATERLVAHTLCALLQLGERSIAAEKGMVEGQARLRGKGMPRAKLANGLHAANFSQGGCSGGPALNGGGASALRGVQAAVVGGELRTLEQLREFLPPPPTRVLLVVLLSALQACCGKSAS